MPHTYAGMSVGPCYGEAHIDFEVSAAEFHGTYPLGSVFRMESSTAEHIIIFVKKIIGKLKDKNTY